MGKKTPLSPSQNWAAIGYLTDKSEELDDSLIKEEFLDSCVFMHKFGRTHAMALSPLHSPDLTQDKKEAMLEEAHNKYLKKREKLKSKEAIIKLDSDYAAEVEEIDTKELKQHYHLLIRFKKQIRASSANAFLGQFCACLSIDKEPLLSFTSVARIGNVGKYYEYLSHWNDYDKEQFDELPLIYPSGYRFSCKADTEEARAMKLSEVERLAYSGDFSCYAALYEHIDAVSKQEGLLEWAITKDIARRNKEHLDKLCYYKFTQKHGKLEAAKCL